jgi:hypothetical protein
LTGFQHLISNAIERFIAVTAERSHVVTRIHD